MASYTLGKFYHEQNKKQYQKAFDWFMVAARKNHTEACYYVGLYYQNGLGVKKDLKQAVIWYEKAALNKDKDALYHLAMILIRQEEKDFVTIAKLLHEAAKQGHPNAQYNLAVMYHKGDGLKQDNDQALYWYEKAAEKNLAIALYNLGMIYFEGRLVPKDEEKAKSLWQKAADQGFEQAVKLMNSILNYEKLQKSGWQS